MAVDRVNPTYVQVHRKSLKSSSLILSPPLGRLRPEKIKLKRLQFVAILPQDPEVGGVGSSSRYAATLFAVPLAKCGDKIAEAVC